MKHPASRLPLFLFALLLCASPACADVRLPKVFSNGMVLQRDAAVPLFGWADEGETVSVTILEQTSSAVAQGGKWRVDLKPLKAGGPVTLRIVGKNTIELKDVLVGDVWISCGQSNMMMGLGSVHDGATLLAESANFPGIRAFNAEGNSQAVAPAEDLKGGSWFPTNPNTLSGFSAVSYLFGRALHQRLAVPIGLINAVAIVPAEAWVDRATLDEDPFLAGAATSPLGGGRSYNGMIAPLQPFAIKGVIYYQGEYNVGRGREYRRLFPALIDSWRKTWNQPALPFLFVQLAALGEHKGEADKLLDMPSDALAVLHSAGLSSAWAELREAQLLTVKTVPKTGMAVAIDVGDPQDIHPKSKRPVAERLALAARAVAYGEEIVLSGPIFESLEFQGPAVRLLFKHVGGGLIAKGGPLQGFELGRADGSYVFAQAQIRGDSIVVSSKEVPKPVAVRYAWADFPRCNLYNAEGLPASPFREFLAEQAHAADAFTISFKNPSFEDAGKGGVVEPAEWVLRKGAVRSDIQASAGNSALRLPAGGEATQDGVISVAATRYDWNSDPLERVNFRPGYAFGYELDIAAGSGTPSAVTAYLRLCGHSTAEAHQYWGGVPQIATRGSQFVTRRVAGTMTSNFDIGGGGAGVGILLAFLPSETNKGELLLDNLSPVTILRPLLVIDDATAIRFGEVAPRVPAVSAPRTLKNGQARVLSDHRSDHPAEATQISTILYGTANLKAGVYGNAEHVRGTTDDVGAILTGRDAAMFEFVTTQPGGTLHEVKLLGSDGKPGLSGGTTPESEQWAIKFLGAAKPTTYSATVRIVTQAANVGTRSRGNAGEPVEAMYYLDVPITARVGP